jgi:hypothetical protein
MFLCKPKQMDFFQRVYSMCEPRWIDIQNLCCNHQMVDLCGEDNKQLQNIHDVWVVVH